MVLFLQFKPYTKASNEAILQNICSWGMVSRKIVSVLTKSWESSPGKFDLFVWYFLLLENLKCSNEILDKISWKIWCVLIHVASPEKFICVLGIFLILLENLMCSRNLYKKSRSWKKRTDILANSSPAASAYINLSKTVATWKMNIYLTRKNSSAFSHRPRINTFFFHLPTLWCLWYLKRSWKIFRVLGIQFIYFFLFLLLLSLCIIKKKTKSFSNPFLRSVLVFNYFCFPPVFPFFSEICRYEKLMLTQ